jgi:hypothetical protein
VFEDEAGPPQGACDARTVEACVGRDGTLSVRVNSSVVWSGRSRTMPWTVTSTNSAVTGNHRHDFTFEAKKA